MTMAGKRVTRGNLKQALSHFWTTTASLSRRGCTQGSKESVYIQAKDGINALQLRGRSRSCLTVLTSLDPVYQRHIMVFQAFLKEL